MAERPILFSGPMVRAILSGNKTQTRRVMKPQPGGDPRDDGYLATVMERCPYGQVGTRLWVREHVRICGSDMDGAPLMDPPVYYMADGPCPDPEAWPFPRPAIHMPRWASRITLEVTSVRVERVQDISEEDAIAEGIEQLPSGLYRNYDPSVADFPFEFARTSFRTLWDSINAKRGCGWEANLWNWVLTFKRVEVPACA